MHDSGWDKETEKELEMWEHKARLDEELSSGKSIIDALRVILPDEMNELEKEYEFMPPKIKLKSEKKPIKKSLLHVDLEQHMTRILENGFDSESEDCPVCGLDTENNSLKNGETCGTPCDICLMLMEDTAIVFCKGCHNVEFHNIDTLRNEDEEFGIALNDSKYSLIKKTCGICREEKSFDFKYDKFNEGKVDCTNKHITPYNNGERE